MTTPSSPEEASKSEQIKSLPLVKVKRVRGGNQAMYRVYKWVNGNYKIKRTFYTAHQASRYMKGFGKEANKKVTTAASTGRKPSDTSKNATASPQSPNHSEGNEG